MLTSPQKSGAFQRADLSNRVNETRARITLAATQYGRAPESICLLAVSKTQPAEVLRAMTELGQHEFGENYLQEALPKMDALADLPLTWHYIGQIQSNKTAPIAQRFDWVHTLDRERVARRLNEQRPHYAAPLNVCIQVRLADEAGKGGIEPGELPALARAVREMPKLRLRGLMCIPPPHEAFAEQLAAFTRLRTLAEELQSVGMPLDTLSMGMSGDLEAAIAAGATIVRIGTALFGPRPAHPRPTHPSPTHPSPTHE